VSAPILIIGGGLAGSEAAWQIAQRGLPVILHEMRPNKATPAHHSDQLAELVCSNSLRSDDSDYNAVGLLHDEMRRGGSLILSMADKHKLPAGGALAVDRDLFAADVTAALEAHPLITIKRGEITALPLDDAQMSVLVASGPLTSDALAQSIRTITGEESLHFFDAIAPIVERESIDMNEAWMQSRYDKGDGSDYINCALDKDGYEAFIAALLAAETVAFKEWEKNTPYFEGCLPIEVMASRGIDTLRYGPMKPVGLTNPHAPDKKSHAILQLRQDNVDGTLWNIVGFQTKMKYGDQKRVFRLIPALKNAVFARLGGIHRNTFINSPRLLDHALRLKSLPHIRFAGQVMGVEGYVESAAMGFVAGLLIAQESLGQPLTPPPRTTAMGALLAHVTGQANADTFQPMNVTFSLFPPITTVKGKRERKKAYATRAKEDFGAWLPSISAAV
jgi:methylenetetrahydrofolate--tRNA-(uracil-5-)-methyltransferase